MVTQRQQRDDSYLVLRPERLQRQQDQVLNGGHLDGDTVDLCSVGAFERIAV